MSNSRHLDKLKRDYWDPSIRRVRAMLSWRRIDLAVSNGDEVTALGREDENGDVESDKMDMLSPVGLIGRPEGNATVETLTGYIGGDGNHPVAVGTLDHTRRAVISTVGLEADETIIYTSTLVIKLTADGTIELRTLNGTAVPLALKSDVDSLKAQLDALQTAFNAHTHLYAPGPGSPVATAVPVPTATGTSSVAGTAVLLGE